MDDVKLDADSFAEVKARLEEIAQIVADDDVPLDEALDLFEEAVALGMQVSDLLEVGVLSDADSPDQAVESADADAAFGDAAFGDAADVPASDQPETPVS